MSDVKNETIIPYWKILARFGAHIFPRGDMHTCCYCETFDEAQDAMDWCVKGERIIDYRSQFLPENITPAMAAYARSLAMERRGLEVQE